MKELTHPKHGIPLDHADKPVTSDPVEGGVCMINASVPPDHEAHIVYRELTDDERRQQDQDHSDAVSFHRANAWIFLRMRRDELLRRTDYLDNYTNVPGKWLDWRQALLDLPATVEDPEDFDWPTPPGAISALFDYKEMWPELDWKKFYG